jgi:hypothetical protein
MKGCKMGRRSPEASMEGYRMGRRSPKASIEEYNVRWCEGRRIPIETLVPIGTLIGPTKIVR